MHTQLCWLTRLRSYISFPSDMIISRNYYAKPISSMVTSTMLMLFLVSVSVQKSSFHSISRCMSLLCVILLGTKHSGCLELSLTRSTFLRLDFSTMKSLTQVDSKVFFIERKRNHTSTKWYQYPFDSWRHCRPWYAILHESFLTYCASQSVYIEAIFLVIDLYVISIPSTYVLQEETID